MSGRRAAVPWWLSGDDFYNVVEVLMVLEGFLAWVRHVGAAAEETEGGHYGFGRVCLFFWRGVLFANPGALDGAGGHFGTIFG